MQRELAIALLRRAQLAQDDSTWAEGAALIIDVPETRRGRQVMREWPEVDTYPIETLGRRLVTHITAKQKT